MIRSNKYSLNKFRNIKLYCTLSEVKSRFKNLMYK